MSDHREKRQSSREFKINAVRLYEASGKWMRALEWEIGFTTFLLSKWEQQLRTEEATAFPAKGNLPEKDTELKRLQREIEVLRRERDILKKQ